MKGLAVLASGTDAGKTFVSCRIVEDLRARGRRVRVRKPVVSGFVDDSASDPARLMAAAASGEPLDVVSPWRFRDPVSPDQAARNEGVVVEFAAVVAACAAADADVVVVETAGGVMSPLCEQHTQVDLVAAVGAAAVVVVDASYLGSISHGLTAVHAVMARGVEVVAVVVNRGPAEPFRRFLPGAFVVDVDDRAALADRISAWLEASES